MKFNLKNTYFNDLPKIFYSKSNPTLVAKPEFVIFNGNLARELYFTKEEIDNILNKKSNWVKILSGNEILEDSIPIAKAYAGHQFGQFNMLGDGRAHLLGEKENIYGNLVDIELKGSGKTAYSRYADGRATLKSMLREYIISESMFHLKVPTTRALSVIKTGEKIIRKDIENGAILTRIANSHIRVGTFEFAARFSNIQDLKKLADYTIDRLFPHISKKYPNSNMKYIKLIFFVMDLQAKLISKWKSLGFIHGVMNTDNMSISGETIDYGPCAFMDIYRKNTVFSSIDYFYRYSYENQEKIALWNLAILAESIFPLFKTNEIKYENMISQDEAKSMIECKIKNFNEYYKKIWINDMRKKIGFISYLEENLDNEEKFINELLELMEKYKADYTNTFIALTENVFNLDDKINATLYNSEEFKNWKEKWNKKLLSENIKEDTREKIMKKNNPKVIPRNHIVEDVLMEAELGNYNKLNEFLKILSDPYNYDLDIDDKYIYPIITKIPYKTYCGT